ncbi:MAG: hypothetical protein CMJ65_08800 [Planctomycetaceae bacterium]|nr:hypothetical protein [Planctomycetaceae bacterium]
MRPFPDRRRVDHLAQFPPNIPAPVNCILLLLDRHQSCQTVPWDTGEIPPREAKPGQPDQLMKRIVGNPTVPFLALVATLCCSAGCSERPPTGTGGALENDTAGFVPPALDDPRTAISETLDGLGFTETVDPPVDVMEIESGRLVFMICDNSRSVSVLNGLQSLVHRDGEDRFEAFKAGLNLEHLYSGHRDDHNRFCPRRYPFLVCRDTEGPSFFLIRVASQSPWSVDHVTRLTPAPPHAIDIEFRCRFHDVARFGTLGYAGFFWANYMHQLQDVGIHFRGVDNANGEEQWIRANSMGGWETGTYLAAGASPLTFDSDHNMKSNLRSFDYPRFTQPFLFCRAANNMVLILMFDRLQSEHDEIRFSQFAPAVDFQYVIHGLKSEKRYGFRARLVWKPWVTADDCLREFRSWQSALPAGN